MLEIELYAPNIFENLICTEQTFTEEEIEKIQDNEKLEWSDFKNALILCNFEGTLESYYSIGGTVGIASYEIKRRENGKNSWDTIYSDTFENFVSQIKDGFFVLTDYGVKNNTTYFYRIYSLNSDGTNSYIQNQITTKWDVYTLTPFIEKETKDINLVSIEADPIMDINGEPIIWTFEANCEEGSFTKNQDITQFDTYSKFPTFSIGQNKFFTIDFTGLLGEVKENGEYYEPLNKLQKWNEFVDMNYPCIYKNPKGEKRIVLIQDSATNTFSNEYMNYFVDENNFITNRPTTVSFSMTEIKDSADITLCKIGE